MMLRITRRLSLLAFVLAVYSLGQLRDLRADDAAVDEVEPAVPFVVVNIASVDRALTDISWMFDSIQRGDMKDVIGGLLGQAGDLKGVDRTRPFGQIIFLDTSALPPRPAVVFFVPIQNLEEALTTVTRAPVTVRKVADRADEYELLGQGDGDGVEAVIRVIGSTAFISPEEMADILDRMPDMERICESLASRYDAAATVQVKAIPEGVRQVFVNFLRTQADIDLQRRDDEPEEQYLVRRANGLNALQLIEQVALQGEDLTIGWNAEPEKHSGYFDLTLNATPDSELAQVLDSVASKPTMFAPLRDANRPLTVNLSWLMNKREQEAVTGLLKAVKVVLDRELPDMAQPGGPIEQLHTSLQATVDAGHVDLFLQMHASDVGEFVFLGGLKIAGAQAFGKGLEQFLQGLVLKIEQDKATNANLAAHAPTFLLNADAHQGVSFHKISPTQLGSDEERLYGGTPDMYLGTSSRAVWFAVGRDQAMPSLRTALDTLLTAPPAERTAEGNVPLSVTVRVAPWLELPLPDQPGAVPEVAPGTEPTEEQQQARRDQRRFERARDRREIAEEAFNATDGIRIDGRPTESGFRTRIHLDEGFVRLLGLIISREYDRSQL
jgi:hypothetical protein